MRPVFIIGFMGAGKSTVGHLLAGSLGRPFLDLDTEIEKVESKTVDELFVDAGESGFREAERAALLRAAQVPDAIVACGGGVVTDEGSRSILLGSGTVVYLAVSPEEALARVGAETVGRPLLRGARPEAATALLRSRERLYETVADIIVDTVGRSPEAVAGEIAAKLEADR